MYRQPSAAIDSAIDAAENDPYIALIRRMLEMLTGKPMKHKVISRAIAYHGTTFGALSINGIPAICAAGLPSLSAKAPAWSACSSCDTPSP